ncbi:hypothetical protein DVH24_040206 [Malus domestica]|uniref:Uncharacterized protein n=1 Tax=Malus domestica TaxID=3750 RepID=A0A498I847_MALDO|nr:hypothetical protein DVH24_040206 [Malus domestica]
MLTPKSGIAIKWAAMESLIMEREARLEIERRQNSLSYEHRRVQRELLSATQKWNKINSNIAYEENEVA